MTVSEIIFTHYALKELQGKEANTPEILKFFAEIGHKWVKTDETAWCAATVNYVLKMAGFPYTGKLDARSFLNLGERVSVPKPLGSSNEFVDLVVFWRESVDSWKGHVGFFIKERGNLIYTLGGNQSNQIKISAYDRGRLLEYRRIYKTEP